MLDAGPMELRLYVAGETPRARQAIRTVRDLLDSLPGGPHHLEVVDVERHPGMAEADRILATPALLRLAPPPTVRLVGDLNREALQRFLLDEAE